MLFGVWEALTLAGGHMVGTQNATRESQQPLRPSQIADLRLAASKMTGPTRRAFHSILKFFQVDIAGMFRMTSRARYFKEGVGSSRPNWRWIMCFLERPKANTSCKALVKCCRRLCGSSDDIKSSMTSTRHSPGTFALRLPTVYAGRL